jgi:hypothetical protein
MAAVTGLVAARAGPPAELESGEEPLGRVNREGGGRKRAVALDPGYIPRCWRWPSLMCAGIRCRRCWTTKSTRHLAAELTRAGHRVPADTVADLLREEGFSLQGNARTVEGKQHPDRDVHPVLDCCLPRLFTRLADLGRFRW